MKRFLLTLTLVVGSVLAASVPQSAHAQYGFYGTFSGGGHNYVPHVRSLQPYGYAQPAYTPYFSNAYRPQLGYQPNYYIAPGYGNGIYGPAYGNGYGPAVYPQNYGPGGRW